MNNGIYHVQFTSSIGGYGEGLAVVRDGTINGGDYCYFYKGTFETSGDSFEGKIEVKRWGFTNDSVFGPMDYFTLDIKGVFESRTFEITGNISGQSDQKIGINGKLLSEIAMNDPAG